MKGFRYAWWAFAAWVVPAAVAAAAPLQAKWSLEVPTQLVAVGAANRLFIAHGRSVAAFEAQSGNLVYRHQAKGAVTSLSAMANHLVVVSGGDVVQLLDQANGQERLSLRRRQGVVAASAHKDALVLVRKDALVEAVGLDGKRRWRQVLSDPPRPSLWIDDQWIGAADDTYVHLLRLADGARMWRFAVGGPAPSLRTAAGVVVAAGKPTFLTSVATDTGKPQWSLQLRRPGTVAPIRSGGMILVAAAEHNEAGIQSTLIRAFDERTGSLLWGAREPTKISALAATGSIVVAASGRALKTFDARSGLELGSVRLPSAASRLLGQGGLIVASGPRGVSVLSAPVDERPISPLDISLRALAPTGPNREEIEALAVRYAQREVARATGHREAPLIIRRRVGRDPLRSRPLLVLEMLTGGGDVARVGMAADRLEVLSWSFERAAVGSTFLSAPRALVASLARGRAPMASGATLRETSVEKDAEGDAYLVARFGAGANGTGLELRLNPTTGGLIGLSATWKVDSVQLKAWRQTLAAAPIAAVTANASASQGPALPGTFRHFRMASEVFDAAFDGKRLWVATDGGAYSVDPTTGAATRFTSNEGLLDNGVRAIAAGGDGSVWMATARGLAHITAGQPISTYPYGLAGAVPNFLVRRLAVVGAKVLAATNRGVLVLAQGRFTLFRRRHGLLSEKVRDVAVGPKAIWAATARGLARYDGKRWEVLRERDGLAQNDTVATLVDRSGRVWAASSERGVSRFDGKRWTGFRKQTAYGVSSSTGPDSDAVLDFAVDTPGAVWAVHREGLSRYFNDAWLHFPIRGAVRNRKLSRVTLAGRRMICVSQGSGQGLVAFTGQQWLPDFVPPHMDEPPGGEWIIVTSNGPLVGARAYGVAQYTGGRWVRHAIRSGPFSGLLRASEAATVDAQGRPWVASRGVLCALKGGQWKCYRAGPESHPVSSIAAGPKGDVWVATRGGGIGSWAQGRWEAYGAVSGLSSLEVVQVAVAGDGAVFALVVDGPGLAIVRRSPGSRKFRKVSSGAGKHASVLAVDGKGVVHLGTAGGVLLRWSGERFVLSAPWTGLPLAAVSRLVFDGAGRPWVSLGAKRGVHFHDGTRWVALTRQGRPIGGEVKDLASRDSAVWIATDDGVLAYSPP